jgi:hypothetical protein
MSKKTEMKTVLIETMEGPIEFKVTIRKDGGLTWNAGKYLLRDRRVFISLQFAGRIREAVRLMKLIETTDG